MNKKISDLTAATTPLAGTELLEIVQGGTSKKVAASDLVGSGGAVRDVLTAARTYYVRADGSDSNDGLANTSGGAFLTIQKAINVVSGELDLVTYDVTINVNDATRTAAVTLKRYLSSGGAVYLVGNAATPANCVISVTSGNCFSTNDFAGPYDISGFKLVTTTSGRGLSILGQASTITFKNIDFGACASAHISVANGSSASASGNYSITGSAPWHYGAFSNSTINVSSRTVTITGTPAFSSAFCLAQTTGMVLADSITFSGSATGTRYSLSLNAVANTAGGGANYFPGNGAGNTATGAQYA